jgi:hypothetical protein
MSLITERDVQVAKEGQTVPAEDVKQVFNLFEVK